MPDKVGAGLLFNCCGYVLLLLRRSAHNDKTWGLPGGNADVGDKDLLATATREATEEMGHLPEAYKVRSTVLVRRGKRLQKEFTVLVADVPLEAKESFTPHLNKEHRDWHWFSLEGLFVLWDHQQKAGVEPAAPEAPGAEDTSSHKHHHKHHGKGESGDAYIKEHVRLHPVVSLLLAPENRDKLGPVAAGGTTTTSSGPEGNEGREGSCKGGVCAIA